MRHPNGYGSVAKLSGNRRNPFIVRKTKGFDNRGYPIYEIIGYYPTREDGLVALAKYNKDPYDIEREKMTLKELFDMWLEKKAHKLGTSNLKCLKSAFPHCKNLQNKKYKDIKSYHMQDCIDNCGKSYSTQGNIKNLFGHLDKFALELDVINRCYASLLITEPTPETSREPFTEDEINKVWDLYRQGFPYADSVLVLLYSGMRITELLIMKTADVDLEQGIMRGGIKTTSGKDRVIPIHSKVLDIIKSWYNQSNEYLLTKSGKALSYKVYYEYWNSIMDKLGRHHTAHECRHTTRTLLDNAGANKRCIDLIMGHKSKDVGERIYTHKTIEQLKETIELIKA